MCIPQAHIKSKTPQPCITQTQAYINQYDALYVEEMNEDNDIKETPQTTKVEKDKMPLPTFNDEWDRIDNFIRQNKEYYCIQEITSPTKKATTTLSLLNKPEVEEWNADLKKWLEGIPSNYNIPILWDLFLQELKIKAQDVQQTNALTKIYNLKMKGLKVKQYISQFEELAEKAGLTATNPDTTYPFMKGLTTQVHSNICKKPIYGYRMARAYALDDVLVTQMALHLIHSQNPTLPKEQETLVPKTKKRPLVL